MTLTQPWRLILLGPNEVSGGNDFKAAEAPLKNPQDEQWVAVSYAGAHIRGTLEPDLAIIQFPFPNRFCLALPRLVKR